MDIAETRTFGVLSIGLTVGFIAFISWLFRPPPKCQKTFIFGQSVHQCRYHEGHAGNCAADWMTR